MKNRESYVRLVKRLQKSWRNGACLYAPAGASECGEHAIRSHTIQRAGALQKVAVNGTLLRLFFNPLNFNKPGKVDFEPIGIKEASTFPGFCAEHDHAVFSKIEDSYEALDLYSVFLFCYRAICVELFKKLRSIENFEDNEVMKKAAERGGSEYLGAILEGSYRAIADLQRIKRQYELALDQNDLRGFSAVATTFESTLPFVYTGAFAPEYTFTGANCMKGDALSFDWDAVCCYCGSVKDTNLFIMGGFGTHAKHDVSGFIASFSRVNPALHSSYILNLGVEHIENMYFNPGWVSNLEENEKHFLIEKMYSGLPFSGPRAQYALIPKIKIETAPSTGTLWFGESGSQKA